MHACSLYFQNGLKRRADITTITYNTQIISIFFSDQICQTDGPGNRSVD